MRYWIVIIALITSLTSLGQGILAGNVMDEKKRPLDGTTVQLISFNDTTSLRTLLTDKNGAFQFENIGFGLYKLRLSYVGFLPAIIDSIHFRTERFDFN